MSEFRADAPGRVNLIGDHTDYHDGFVLPCAIPQRTIAALAPRPDASVRANSDEPGAEPIEFRVGDEQPGLGWGDYVQGLTWVLGRMGCAPGGFDLHIRSTVPVGSGLSSSAALEISTLRAIRSAFGLPLSDIDLARAGQRAEVEFVGAPVGIMDQMASSLAGERRALFLDTRSLAYELIPLPPGLELVVIDSGVAHQHAGGDYVTRRRESEEAARLLDVPTLRDAPPDALERLRTLPPLLARRARHIITENARVLEARTALLESDLERLGELFRESHASLRDDYEVSVPAVDLLVELADRHPKAYGARITGGGFGGAIVIAAAAGAGAAIAGSVREAFAERTGRTPAVLVPPEA